VVCALAAIITTTLLYLVDWEKESNKAKALVLKADLVETMGAEGDSWPEDEYNPAQNSALCSTVHTVDLSMYRRLEEVYHISMGSFCSETRPTLASFIGARVGV